MIIFLPVTSALKMMIIVSMSMFTIIQSFSFRIIDSQKLDVPVWSLSTINHNNISSSSSSSSNMNLITYAYPISIKPKIRWAISLYKGSLTHSNFKTNRWGMLQRLSTSHLNAFSILGKQSGYTINKIEALNSLGYAMTTIDHNQLNDMNHSSTHGNKIAYIDSDTLKGSIDSNRGKVMVFTDTSYVVYLKCNDDGQKSIPIIDVGDHELFICDQIATFKCQTYQSTNIPTTTTITTDASPSELVTHSDDDAAKDSYIDDSYDHSQELTTAMLRSLHMI